VVQAKKKKQTKETEKSIGNIERCITAGEKSFPMVYIPVNIGRMF
jgi:hypothetical protein